MNLSQNRSCPNSSCKYFQSRNFIVKAGFYFRACDSRKIQRFKCKSCNKYFSSSTSSREYKFKVRREIFSIYDRYCSLQSIRRIAKSLKLNRKTVVRKIIYLSEKADLVNEKRLIELSRNPIREVQFDDLITTEHTKMKPLSVSVAVDKKTREILGLKVGRIPAFGHLAHKSRKKYGLRVNQHSEKLNDLFSVIQKAISPNALIESDEHSTYPRIVKKYFPHAKHVRFEGGRSCVAGQGELKKKYFDPLFSLNHSCAMLRANINRLIRKTWCTTKDPLMLEKHLAIYQQYHNRVLLNLF